MLFSSKDLRKLIIPLMFEQLLAVLVGLVDTLMVSQSGEAAVAGSCSNMSGIISFLKSLLLNNICLLHLYFHFMV